MNLQLLLIQALNGVQYGLLLFLLAAGLTLVLGIMNFVNLAHASLFMLGAYLGAAAFAKTGSFIVAAVAAVLGTLAIGLIVERTTLLAFYARDHLDQVLATFGLILFFNELVRVIWGPQSVYMRAPDGFTGTVDVLGVSYPSYRFLVIIAGLAVAGALYIVIHHTRVGMLIRAGASNARMVSVLGVNIRLLNSLLFGLGAALAGLAGVMAAPILAVQPGMGDNVLIAVLVVIVIGGIGSIRGAFFGALIVGIVDTVGRVYLPFALRQIAERSFADAAGPAVASMLIYLFMAAVLAFRPQGLFPARK
ncbi:MAG TPA: branched-chain amino acid ABC transporter permease [Burkholderiales bacterium]|nr:branched-chain amino acid ABC transporter permease [Burkholderiales bacterium]